MKLVEAPTIFHEEDDGLKHELIDVSKAYTIVSALKDLKKQIQENPAILKNHGLTSEDTSFIDPAVSILNDKQVSINIGTF